MSEALQRARELSLLEWIPLASSGQHRAPHHLREWCELIESVERGGVRACCAIPVRHYKTWTTIYGVAWLLCRNPKLRVILLVADHERANELGKMIRTVCEQVGVGPVRGENTIVDWKNESGGGVCTMSAKQSRLGRDVDVLICDDPITELTADDAVTRDAVDHAIAHYTARAVRAGQRGSVLIVMSRWHPDDPIGRRLLRKAETWQYVHHGALDADGRAFAEDVWSAESLERTRRELAEVDPSERLWHAQFQNQPFVPGREVFGEPARYVELPAFHGFRDAAGLDMAYSSAATADYFALVVGRAYGGALFLRRTRRTHADLNAIEAEIRDAIAVYGQMPIYSYVSGPEIGAVHYLASRGLQVQAIPARFNKLVRSQRTRVSWNGGKVQVPVADEWGPFMRRVQLFRGAEGDPDDEVDALVSLHDGVMGSSSGAPTTGGRPRY
jgi:Terminase-like family.